MSETPTSAPDSLSERIAAILREGYVDRGNGIFINPEPVKVVDDETGSEHAVMEGIAIVGSQEIPAFADTEIELLKELGGLINNHMERRIEETQQEVGQLTASAETPTDSTPSNDNGLTTTHA